jgi:hypothetical protein
MAEDLNTGQEIPDEEVIWEDYSDAEIIAACTNAIGAMETFDPMTEIDKRRKKRIIRRCIILIDLCTKSLYDNVTDEPEDDE